MKNNEKIHFIDAYLKLSAQEDITIKKAKHSFFGIRVAPDLVPWSGGTMLNSNGEQMEDGTLL